MSTHSDTPVPEDWITLEELCDRTGESRRTVRFYILNGLLSGPLGQGPAARYPPAHAVRLKAIRHLQEEGLQLSRIREELQGLDESQLRRRVRRTLGLGTGRSLGAPVMLSVSNTQLPLLPESPEGWTRSQWERIELEPGVELHLLRPANTAVNRRIQKLLEFHKQLSR
ncbi:MAG: hypothetical protein RLZZ299_795 [Pseudomonadota bacterium]|jgi:DNA-binding transcriptional MerR regulator